MEVEGFKVQYTSTGPSGLPRVTIHKTQGGDAIWGTGTHERAELAFCLALLEFAGVDEPGRTLG